MDLRKLKILDNVPYEDLKIAHSLIDHGADYALIYFWFNLRYCHYWPAFSDEQVEKEVDYYTRRNPEFAPLINTWHKNYLTSITHAKVHHPETAAAVRSVIAGIPRPGAPAACPGRKHMAGPSPRRQQDHPDNSA
jgi:hypothetical protein